jgi:hypothetical protein
VKWTQLVQARFNGGRFRTRKQVFQNALDQMSNYQLATDFHLPWTWLGLKLRHYFTRLPSTRLARQAYCVLFQKNNEQAYTEKILYTENEDAKI